MNIKRIVERKIIIKNYDIYTDKLIISINLESIDDEFLFSKEDINIYIQEEIKENGLSEELFEKIINKIYNILKEYNGKNVNAINFEKIKKEIIKSLEEIN